MHQSKLIRLYLSLSREELRNLKKWLRSPLHHQHEKVVQLFDFLENRKQISAVTLRKDRVFSTLFPGEDYDDARLRIIQNQALETLKAFVGYFKALSIPGKTELGMVSGLISHGFNGMAQEHLLRARAEIAQEAAHSEIWLEQAYHLEKLAFDLSGTAERTASNNLPALFASLSAYFAVSTLRYACIAASHAQISAQQYEVPLLAAILQEVAAGGWKEVPVVNLYFQAYQALTQPDPVYFSALKEPLFNPDIPLHPDERQELLLLTLNFCIKKLNTGEEIFAHEAFDLYQKGLESKFLLDQDSISRFNFKNIVSVGLKVQAYDWTAAFIRDYSPRLDPHYRERYENFNLARLFFARGDHHEARRLLTQVEDFDDEFFNLSARMMLLKIYYEAGELDALQALINSFRRYLQRKSALGYHKKVYLNILSFAQLILDLPPANPDKKARLHARILETNPLAERGWLLAQLARRD